MIDTLAPETIAEHFISACQGELTALKPGNVHVFADGHRMDVAQFIAAAKAAAPHIAKPGNAVGERILHAVRASFAAAGCNTNLGIILLCAPLARAGELSLRKEDLRTNLSSVLAALDVDDAWHAFEAISHANPAGLGDASIEDVREAPSVTLRKAMALAADRDRISKAFDTDFADIFEVGLPILREARVQCERERIDLGFAITTLHMNYLSRFLDSHISRKHGVEAAKAVKHDANAHAQLWSPIARQETFDALLEFDTELKAAGLNPGTTADMVVATLFADLLELSLA